MQRQYVSPVVGVGKVQPGLRQNPSSVAERVERRGVEIHGDNPGRVERDRSYAAGDSQPNVNSSKPRRSPWDSQNTFRIFENAL